MDRIGHGRSPICGVGAGLVRFMVTLCFVLAAVRLYAVPLNLGLAQWPGSEWTSEWYGPGQIGAARAQVEARLEQLPGKQNSRLITLRV